MLRKSLTLFAALLYFALDLSQLFFALKSIG